MHSLLHAYILEHSSWVILQAYTLTQEVLVENLFVAIRRWKYTYACAERVGLGLLRKDRDRERENERDREGQTQRKIERGGNRERYREMLTHKCTR